MTDVAFMTYELSFESDVSKTIEATLPNVLVGLLPYRQLTTMYAVR
jgi:hypothetical protein